MATAEKKHTVEVKLTLGYEEAMALYELLGGLRWEAEGIGVATLPEILEALVDELHRELITG